MGFPDLNIQSLEILRSLLTFLSQRRNAATPGKKNAQYINGLLYFSKFEKCDAISHLHKVTVRK